MTDIDSILDRIRSGLAKHGRKTKIAEDTGINAVRLARIGKPGWNPTAETIRILDEAVRRLFPVEGPQPPQQPE